jgi:hypothetical protein
MLFREIIAVYREDNTRHITETTVCVSFLVLTVLNLTTATAVPLSGMYLQLYTWNKLCL